MRTVPTYPPRLQQGLIGTLFALDIQYAIAYNDYMKEKNENPLIRVTPQTRKDLKILAAHSGETMLQVVARLAQQELQRVQKGGTDAEKF